MIDNPGAFRLLDDAMRTARARWFGRSRPGGGPDFVVNATPIRVAHELYPHGFCPDWPFSYYYEGEDANLVRYRYEPQFEYPHRQDHVRLFDSEYQQGWTGIEAHVEPHSLVHKHAHINGIEHSRGPAIHRVRESLLDAGIYVVDSAAPAWRK